MRRSYLYALLSSAIIACPAAAQEPSEPDLPQIPRVPVKSTTRRNRSPKVTPTRAAPNSPMWPSNACLASGPVSKDAYETATHYPMALVAGGLATRAADLYEEMTQRGATQVLRHVALQSCRPGKQQ